MKSKSTFFVLHRPFLVGSRAPAAAGIRYWISGFSETHVSRESSGVDQKAADLKVSALESSQIQQKLLE